MVTAPEVVLIPEDTIPPERSTLRSLPFRSVPASAKDQAHYRSVLRAPEASNITTAGINRALAGLRAGAQSYF